MRLWHYSLIPVLPRSQLLAQWRELNSIYVKEDNHILINYIYNYSKDDLYTYSELIRKEFLKRGYTIRSFEKMNNYFSNVHPKLVKHPFKADHDEQYLEICYFNLKEKYIRGQKDYDEALFLQLQNIYFQTTQKNG